MGVETSFETIREEQHNYSFQRMRQTAPLIEILEVIFKEEKDGL